MPTADRVTRVFGGDAEDDAEEEELEEIDFSEIGRLQAEVDAAAANIATSAQEEVSVEQEFTGFYVDTTPSYSSAHDSDSSGSDHCIRRSCATLLCL